MSHSIPQTIACPVCRGDGYDPGDANRMHACIECAGLGVVPWDRPEEPQPTEAELAAMARHFGEDRPVKLVEDRLDQLLADAQQTLSTALCRVREINAKIDRLLERKGGAA